MSEEEKYKKLDQLIYRELPPDRYCYIHNFIVDKDKEIERLNNIIKEAIEYIRKQTHDEDTGNYLGYPDLIDDEHLLNILQGSDEDV